MESETDREKRINILHPWQWQGEDYKIPDEEEEPELETRSASGASGARGDRGHTRGSPDATQRKAICVEVVLFRLCGPAPAI